VSSLLADAFRSVTDAVDVGLEYEFDGERGEIDCVAVLGDTLSVCECKNTLLPCSAFEQRTMFDHIQKAVTQLDRVKSLWGLDGFKRYLGQKLGRDLSAAHLRTCVVLSKRLLSGASIQGHPIRQAREFA